MRNMNRNVTGFARTAQRSFQQATRAIGQLARVGFVALGAATAYIAREFIQFDDSLTSAAAKFPEFVAGTEEGAAMLERLGRVAREVGATTKFTATEAAQGLDFLAMAGFGAEQAMAALPGVANLAVVAQTDLATATDIASDAIGAFGLMTQDTAQLQVNFTRINDAMAQTMSTANTNMEDLFEAVKSGAPAFTAAGQDMETFNALAGIMANSGVKGSEAGTQLRNTMLRLANPTAEAAGLLRELGVVTQDEQGDFRDIVDILRDFESGLEGMGTAQRSAALATIFGARSVTGINLLLQEGSERIDDYRDSIYGAAGASQRMADIIGSSLANKLQGLKSAAIEVGFKFIEGFREKAAGAIDRVTEALRNMDVEAIIERISAVVGRFQRMWESGFLPAVLAGVATFKVLTIAVGAYQAALVAAKAIQLAFNVAAAANPLGAIVLTVSALVAAITFLIQKWDAIRERILETKAGQAIFGQGADDPEEGRARNLEQYGISANSGLGAMASRVTEVSESRSQLDVNLNNLPAGSTVRQTGLAPHIMINTAYQRAGIGRNPGSSR